MILLLQFTCDDGGYVATAERHACCEVFQAAGIPFGITRQHNRLRCSTDYN
jgi:hypothetical protein